MELDISIIVLSHNHWEYTERLIHSLATNTCDTFCELIVVDNGSEPATCQAISDLCRSQVGKELNIRPCFLDANIGIANGRNVGGNNAKARHLLFLDNDIEIFDPFWLRQLALVIDAHRDRAIVGGVLRNPDQSIQFAGGTIGVDGRVVFSTSASGSNEDQSPAKRSSMYCLGACLMTSKETWDVLGGFDSMYNPMDYEDIDYCFRAAEIGIETFIALDAQVIHHAHVTTGTSGFPRVRQYLISGRKFIARWKDRLSRGKVCQGME